MSLSEKELLLIIDQVQDMRIRTQEGEGVSWECVVDLLQTTRVLLKTNKQGTVMYALLLTLSAELQEFELEAFNSEAFKAELARQGLPLNEAEAISKKILKEFS